MSVVEPIKQIAPTFVSLLIIFYIGSLGYACDWMTKDMKGNESQQEIFEVP